MEVMKPVVAFIIYLRPPDHYQKPTVLDYSYQFDLRIIPGSRPNNQQEQILHDT